MDDYRVLITGGAGFIGSNLANHLVVQNDVTVVDDLSLGTPANLDDEVHFYERSVLDGDLPADVDIVFHLASLSSYAMHERDPQQGARVNVEGFVNVVEQARKAGCETVVYASTSSVYGSQTAPCPESMSVSARTGYEASKLAREQYARYFSTHYGLSTAGMRLFSVYQGYGGAEAHKREYANVIAQFADDIANGRPPTLYGDGTQTRDFIHVNDVVRALELAAQRKLDGIFNIGTGQRHSFNTVVELLADELGSDIGPEYVENPIPNEVYVRNSCANTTKIREATEWEPTIGLKQGVSLVCDHYL